MTSSYAQRCGVPTAIFARWGSIPDRLIWALEPRTLPSLHMCWDCDLVGSYSPHFVSLPWFWMEMYLLLSAYVSRVTTHWACKRYFETTLNGGNAFVFCFFALQIQITVTFQSPFSVEFHVGITTSSYAQRHGCLCIADTDNRDIKVAVFCWVPCWNYDQ